MTSSSETLLLAIDQGTTSSRAVLFNAAGDVRDIRQRELALVYPENGWVEQDPEVVWSDTLWACRELFKASSDALAAVAAVGITNQRETTIVWDRNTGEPVYNAIVWQDRRTASGCDQLRQQGHEADVTAKTGLLLDPYFSATKLAWILDNVEGVRERAEAGHLAFGTIDCFLLWRLTAGQIHATDVTNASRTLLFNIHNLCWDNELLSLFGIPRELLPEVYDNTAHFGFTSESLFGKALPVTAMIGDQQSALAGQACFDTGTVKATYGTGCFMLMNLGAEPIISHNRLLTSIAYRIGGEVAYALEGSIFIAGAAIQWLRDGLHLFQHASESEAMATSVPGNAGVYFVPALTGLGAPYWRPEVKGAIVGLGRDTTAAHITRAALEAQAYQTRDLLAAMVADVNQHPALIRADGGLVANQFVCQFLADIVATEIQVPVVTEATAWGAASLAGLQRGVFNDLSEISAVWQLKSRYKPLMAAEQSNDLYRGWQSALASILQ